MGKTVEKDKINKSKADKIGPPKSNADKKYLINTLEELSAWLRSLTYDDIQKILSGEYSEIKNRVAKESNIDVEISPVRLRGVRGQKQKGRRSSIHKFAVTTEITKYMDDALSIRQFFDRGLINAWDFEERKDIVVCSRRRGDILEEYRFDKEVIDYKGKRYVPSPTRMGRDLLSTLQLFQEKKTNPLSFSWKEKERTLGYSADQIKNMGGGDIERDRMAFIQLSEMRFYRWKIDKDGEKRLQVIDHPSPYETIWLPTKPGEKYGVLIRASYLKSMDPKTYTIKPGKFKMLSQNPYRGHYVESRAFEFLEKDVHGRSLEIKAETILRNKLDIPDSRWKRPEYCLGWIDRWLQVAKNEGYNFEIENAYKMPDGTIKKTGSKSIINLLKKIDLEDMRDHLIPKKSGNKVDEKPIKIHDETLAGDCRKWKITFFSPIRPKYELSGRGKLLAVDIISWLYDLNDFGIKNPRDRAQFEMESFIKFLHEDEVETIFKEVRESPTLFTVDADGRTINGATTLWNTLKKRKAEKYGDG